MGHAACPATFDVRRPRLLLSDSRLCFGGAERTGRGPLWTCRRRNKTPFCLGLVPVAPRLNVALERI